MSMLQRSLSTSSTSSMVGMRRLSFGFSEERPYLDCAIPDCPDDGVRIRVCYAGLCYLPSMNASPLRKGAAGFRNGNFFEGFEISGTIECIGDNVVTHDLVVGDPVAVFPHEDIIRQGYADFVIVQKLNNIVKLPPSITLAVGAMMPTGGTLAMSAVINCQQQLDLIVSTKAHCNIVIFGSGSLTHWLIRLLRYSNTRVQDRIHIIVASDDWKGLKTATKLGAEQVVLLEENLHEDSLVERLRGSVHDGIQMAVCLAHDERLQKRAAKCLDDGAVLVVPEFSGTAESDVVDTKNLEIVEVPRGNVENLRTLIRIIDQGESLHVNQPVYKIYPVDDSQKIFEEMQLSDINERPVLQFDTPDTVFAQ